MSEREMTRREFNAAGGGRLSGVGRAHAQVTERFG